MSIDLCICDCKIVDNKIGDRGCRYLVEAKWSKLIVIKLGKLFYNVR